ncbi:MAG: hypothetical protein ACNI27_01810 [Desulfovibrio sp.]
MQTFDLSPERQLDIRSYSPAQFRRRLGKIYIFYTCIMASSFIPLTFEPKHWGRLGICGLFTWKITIIPVSWSIIKRIINSFKNKSQHKKLDHLFNANTPKPCFYIRNKHLECDYYFFIVTEDKYIHSHIGSERTASIKKVSLEYSKKRPYIQISTWNTFSKPLNIYLEENAPVSFILTKVQNAIFNSH